MKKNFYASLCYMGAHGGAIQLTDEYMVYKAQKLVLPDDYKNIKILYCNIDTVNTCRALFIFPAVIINLKNGLNYKFIVFNRIRFLQILTDKSIPILSSKKR